jgi:threonine/homoserine/homoserine lactone efflux protein
MVFGLGCALGCITHTVLAALGVSALIAASPAAFLLKIAGGSYLVYLGWQAIRSKGSSLKADKGQTDNTPLAAHFRKGLIANTINPKVVLFFLAFLPQFVNPAQGHSGWQTAILGLIFTRRQRCCLAAWVILPVPSAAGLTVPPRPASGWTALPAAFSSPWACA